MASGVVLSCRSGAQSAHTCLSPHPSTLHPALPVRTVIMYSRVRPYHHRYHHHPSTARTRTRRYTAHGHAGIRRQPVPTGTGTGTGPVPICRHVFTMIEFTTTPTFPSPSRSSVFQLLPNHKAVERDSRGRRKGRQLPGSLPAASDRPYSVHSSMVVSRRRVRTHVFGRARGAGLFRTARLGALLATRRAWLQRRGGADEVCAPQERRHPSVEGARAHACARVWRSGVSEE